MSLYVIVIYLLNATTGEPQEQYVSRTPMTLEACSKALMDRGPVPVKDGLATYSVCQKISGGVSL